MNNVILYRNGFAEEQELESCSKYFKVSPYRSTIEENTVVIGRYSVLPHYKELETELKIKNSSLINSYEQHCYIADITNYYEDLKEYTPKTWKDWSNLPDNKSFILKGKTNSRKFNWKDLMFCKDKQEVINKSNRLLDDTFIFQQGLVVREYVPLKNLGKGINELPISNEYRFFCLGNKIIAHGFYWFEEYESEAKINDDAFNLVHKIMEIVSKKANFYVVDIAQTENNDWIVVELNDGQMSGLSLIDPDQFYNSLKKATNDL